MEKKCTKCGVVKPLERFSKLKIGVLGKASACKECSAITHKLYKDAHKEHIKEYNKEYKKQNLEYTLEYAKNYSKEKYQNDPIYRFKSNMRTHINVRLKYFLKTKKGSTLEYLGCGWETYIKHLESQFDKNMSWDNYGKYWEVDHIIPLSKDGNFHYTNCQPLTVKENRYKSNKLLP